jgi:SEL1 protein
MFRLGRIYYYGFGSAGDSIQDFALTNGRNYLKSLKWFNRIVRAVWQRDPEAATSPNGHAYQNKQGQWHSPTVGPYDVNKDPKQPVDETHMVAAGLSAGYLGRIYLRGEGVPRNNAKAFLWFSRGATQVSSPKAQCIFIFLRI